MRKKICIAAALGMILATVLSGCSSEKENSLEMAFLKVGKADTVIITCGAKTMLLDCGENDDGEEIVSFLRAKGVKKVDVMLITHYDKDHVGGAPYVLDNVQVDTLICPDYGNDSSSYRKFMKKSAETDCTMLRLDAGYAFSLGSAKVYVDVPKVYDTETEKDFDNNLSLITSLEYEGKKYLFMGDAEGKRIREWLSTHPEETFSFVKMPHHGVYDESLRDFLYAVSPSYAVICDSDRHPADMATLAMLQSFDVTAYETKDGNIYLQQNEEDILFRQ